MDILSILLIVFIVISIISFAYFIVSSLGIKKFFQLLDLEVDCQNSSIVATIKNLGNEDIRAEDIKVYIDNQEATISLDPTILTPHQIGKIYIFFIPSQINIIYRIDFYIWGRRITSNIKYPCESLLLSLQNANLTFVAYSTPHWVVFNYVTGNYLIYQSTNGDLSAELGPSEGIAPILQNISNYTIQTSWSSWDNRPVNSPIIIVKNPSKNSLWIFNWTDPHGSFLFRVYPVENAIDDFLVFWEDLYNPFNPPSSLDDWKDHVVRVTLLPVNTYRIAVYLAKGGYKHQFYIATKSPNPLNGTLAYEKPYGAYWSNYNNGYYDEYKVYTIKIS